MFLELYIFLQKTCRGGHWFSGKVGQTIAFSGLSCFAKARLLDRRHKPIVCPTLTLLLLDQNADLTRMRKLKAQSDMIACHG